MSASRGDENDPELRSFLAGAAGPGPVPEDLVARISRSIAEETSDAGRPRTFDPAVAPRRRRGVVLTTVGVLAVAGLGLGSAIAHHLDDEALTRHGVRALAAVRGHPQQSDPATTTAAAPLGVVGEAGPTSTAVAGAGDPLAGLTILTSGTDYRRGDVVRQIAHVARGETPTDPHAPGAAAGTPRAVVPSSETIARCLDGASIDARQAVLDVATFEGRPALVLLGDAAVGSTGASQASARTAVVLAPDCPSGAAPLHGPEPVG